METPLVLPASPSYGAVELVRILSQGCAMNARLHRTSGAGPHPAVLLLHGFPGGSDLGLAPFLCAAGYHVLFPHYRGSWGSDGSFSWAGAREDAHAALTFLRARAEEHGTDVERISLVGHSVGGWVALQTAAEDPRIAAVASVAGTNLGRLGAMARGDDGVRAAMVAAVRQASDPASGPVRVEDHEGLALDLLERADRYDVDSLAPALRARRVLLVGASGDQEVPVAVHHEPLVNAFLAAGATRLAHTVLPADHAFACAGPTLHGIVQQWLQADAAPPAWTASATGPERRGARGDGGSSSRSGR